LAFLERCPPPSSAADSARYAAARAALAEPVRLSAEETARDALLNSANDLWDARPARCEPDATPADAALAMIQARLAQ
jgi:hypothetical protein